VKSRLFSPTLIVLLVTLPIAADEAVDEAMIAKFKIEGFQHSKVMETLTELTDTFGSRHRGSPSYAAIVATGLPFCWRAVGASLRYANRTEKRAFPSAR